MNHNYDIEIEENEDINFVLEFPTRSVGEETVNSSLDPLKNYFKKNSSILLISQRTNNHSISFDDYLGTDLNKYLYKYVWDGNEASPLEGNGTPNWVTGYNFSCSPDWKNPLNWSTVMGNGAFGSSYAFGALYYPEDNSERSSVETDQSTQRGLNKSNMLGAYHLTESIYERFRFRLYHLMACIRVTILVPDEIMDEEKGKTGFGIRNISGTILNLNPNFSIDWGARSSEEPPILKADVATDPKDFKNIKMFSEPSEDKIIEWELSYFGLEGKDKVREYTFTGLFPPQTLSNTDNILKFEIYKERSTRDIDETYYWSTSQLTTSLQVSPGTITNLVLYLPRTANNAILVKSEIIDWNKSDVDVTLIPDPSYNEI